jgi:alkylation response protein AidB-like acyl-CoA dehydrogenase
LVQELLADSAVDIECARLLTWRAASMVDAGASSKQLTLPSSMAKLAASENGGTGGQQLLASVRGLRIHR